ncbi:MAG: HAD hydrolase-like protein [Rhodospirillales bacterium]
MTSIETPSALLFDWDNTLIDSWGAIHEALHETFVAFDLRPWTLEECKQKVRVSARDGFPPLFGDRWEEALEVFYKAFQRTHLTALAPLAGAEGLLNRLQAQGLPLGIVSNKAGHLLRAEVVALGWQLYFSGVVGANDAPRDKPAPDAPALALEEMGQEASEAVWFVGDTDIDMHCAVNSGCLPVLLRPEAPSVGEFADCSPRHYVASCRDLENLLFG